MQRYAGGKYLFWRRYKKNYRPYEGISQNYNKKNFFKKENLSK